MNTAIIYGTNHGSTHKCAVTLSNKLGSDTKLFNLDNGADIELPEFDTIIIGGSIHAGSINKNVRKFIDKNIKILIQKNIGLYLCCMYEGEKALEQFQNAYPEDLRNKAKAHGLFGGEFDFEKMNFLEKAIVKKVANVEKSVSNLNYSNIKGFAEKILK
jgi:menaquinone-dependent protoporphyrinogen oxidase